MTSDHQLLLIDFSVYHPGGNNKNFRFEPMWLRCNDFKDKVRSFWSEASTEHNCIKKILGICASKLTDWNKCSVGSVKGNLKKHDEKREHIIKL